MSACGEGTYPIRRLHHQQDQAGQDRAGRGLGDLGPNPNTDYRQDDRYHHPQTPGYFARPLVAMAGPEEAPIYLRRVLRRDIVSKMVHDSPECVFCSATLMSQPSRVLGRLLKLQVLIGR